MSKSAKMVSNLNDLSGPQKAAVMLLALGTEAGAAVWNLLEEDEIKTVSLAMAQLGSVDSDAVERLLVDFTSRMGAAGAVTGSYDRTEMLLTQFLPKGQASAIMAEIRGPNGRNMWQKLSNVDAEVLAAFLKNEYPQTVSVVLSKLKPENAARVLTILPEEFAIDVVNRMLKLDTVQKEALDHIEETLRSEFIANLSHTTRRDSHEMMAVVFNAFDRQTETRFLSALDDTNRDAAKKIRALMFTFEDLAKLDPASAQTLMRGIDKDVLARALKGASEQVKSFFLGHMSSRAAKNLQDDMTALGPMRMKDVDDSQAKMVSIAKDLAEKGDIMISKNRAEDELVY
jgi:flagellar motor switch protein FliG